MSRSSAKRFDSGGPCAVQRFDLARVSGSVEKTSQGFLRIPAYLTRAGVFEYRRADGTVMRELRPESEVFKADSLASLKDAPVTLDHPTEGGVQILVTAENVKQLSVGHTGETITRNDSLVGGTLTVTDISAVRKVESRQLKDVSCGYSCSIEQQAGVDAKYGRYDQIQRDIQYNHVALGGYNWGRAGDQVGLRLDSTGAAQVDRFDVPSPAPPDEGRADSRSAPMETIVINGVEYSVDKSLAQAYRADKARAEQELTTLKAAKTELEGRFDAQEQELKSTREKLDKVDDPGQLQQRIDARIELLDQARKVLGDKEEISGTAREIQEKVLKHDNADLDLSGKEDLYVQARFDQFMAAYKPAPAAGDKDQVRADALAAARGANKDDRLDSKAAYIRMMEKNRKAAEKPLTASKDAR